MKSQGKTVHLIIGGSPWELTDKNVTGGKASINHIDN